MQAEWQQDRELNYPAWWLTGIIGGKFLERGRVKKPNQERYGTQLSEYYMAQDMFIGAVVEFNKFQFMLIDADEYAFSYMEAHANEVRLPQGICESCSLLSLGMPLRRPIRSIQREATTVVFRNDTG